MMLRRFLFWCANEHNQFRIQEFESLSKVFGISLSWVFKSSEHPWVILDLPGEAEARQLNSRSLSIKYCVELWAQGEGYQKFHDNLKKSEFSKDSPWFDQKTSFKVHVESFNKKYTPAMKMDKIESVSYLPIKGPVN